MVRGHRTFYDAGVSESGRPPGQPAYLPSWGLCYADPLSTFMEAP